MQQRPRAWFLLGLLALFMTPLGVSAGEDYEFDRVENDAIHFKLPEGSKLASSLKTDLFDLRLLGRIRAPEGQPPYFVFTGKPCQDCPQESAIYLMRPGQKQPVTFVYPGKILDSKSGQLLLQSRAFFGRCVKSRKGDVYVVFQKERVDRRHKMQSSVFLAEPGPDFLEEKLMVRGFPNLNDAVRLVRAKSCKEIDGRNRRMLRKSIDTRRGIKRKNTDDDDDDDDNNDNNDNDDNADSGAKPQDAAVSVPAK